jgi:hypothetical protein
MLGRIGGLCLLLLVVGLPVLSNDFGQLEVWDTEPVAGFAVSTGWRLVGPIGDGRVRIDFTGIVGHNTTGTNQYQFHESTNFTATPVISNSLVEPFDNPPTITSSANIPVGAGGCCAAPHSVCHGDGSCTTTFRGSDGRFRELRIQDASATSIIVDPSATNQLSATIDRYLDGLVVGTADTAAGTNEIYVKPDGASSYTPIAAPPCDSPLTNLHWAAVADPLDDWLITGCRNGGNITIRQIALPSGAINWFEVVTTVPAPDAFRYLQLDHCGQVSFPDQTTGDAIAFAVPRNTDTVVGMMGPIGNPGAPGFSSSRVITGTTNDYFGLDCDNDLLTLVRQGPGGTGTQLVYVDFDDLSGQTNLLSATDDARTPDWINTAPDYAGTITNQTQPEPSYIDAPYLPIVLRTGGLGGQVVYGSVPRVLFFDGFESGDTSFWDATVGLASANGRPAVDGQRSSDGQPAATAAPGSSQVGVGSDLRHP